MTRAGSDRTDRGWNRALLRLLGTTLGPLLGLALVVALFTAIDGLKARAEHREYENEQG